MGANVREVDIFVNGGRQYHVGPAWSKHIPKPPRYFEKIIVIENKTSILLIIRSSSRADSIWRSLSRSLSCCAFSAPLFVRMNWSPVRMWNALSGKHRVRTTSTQDVL